MHVKHVKKMMYAGNKNESQYLIYDLSNKVRKTLPQTPLVDKWPWKLPNIHVPENQVKHDYIKNDYYKIFMNTVCTNVN